MTTVTLKFVKPLTRTAERQLKAKADRQLTVALGTLDRLTRHCPSTDGTAWEALAVSLKRHLRPDRVGA
jgi:hypothetical protein